MQFTLDIKQDVFSPDELDIIMHGLQAIQKKLGDVSITCTNKDELVISLPSRREMKEAVQGVVERTSSIGGNYLIDCEACKTQHMSQLSCVPKLEVITPESLGLGQWLFGFLSPDKKWFAINENGKSYYYSSKPDACDSTGTWETMHYSWKTNFKATPEQERNWKHTLLMRV